jgi:hypothetical protein
MMVIAPAFFIPRTMPEAYEADYAEWAKFCGASVPSVNERIYSITFESRGEKWTATVGEILRGVSHKNRRSNLKGERFQQTTDLADPATVIAIFSGGTFMVATNYRFAPGVCSEWENPFMAGQPESIVYFSRSQ